MAAKRPLVLVLLLAALAGGCGEGDGGFGIVDAATADPNATDAAFARAIVPQEREALALARIARRRALRRELREIAKKMLAQPPERIRELGGIAADLEHDGVRPAGAEMNRRPTGTSGLRDAVSFDFRFMELMIRHLERAVAMSEEEQDRGGHPRLKYLAGELMKTHERELDALRRWLRTWYGEGVLPGEGGGGGGGGEQPAPDGGAPADPPL
ncbi:MAG TPA: DUF305 domain-containing protein [Thermoleophilaceae bacterium]